MLKAIRGGSAAVAPAPSQAPAEIKAPATPETHARTLALPPGKAQDSIPGIPESTAIGSGAGGDVVLASESPSPSPIVSDELDTILPKIAYSQGLLNHLYHLPKPLHPKQYEASLAKLLEHFRALPDAAFRFRGETNNETLLDACLDAYGHAIKTARVKALFLELFRICLAKIPKLADLDVAYSATGATIKRNLLYVEDEFGHNTMMKAIATLDVDALRIFVLHYKDVAYSNPLTSQNLFSYTCTLLEADGSTYANAAIPQLMIFLIHHGFIFNLGQLLVTLQTAPLHPYRDGFNNLISAIDIFYETHEKPSTAEYAEIHTAIEKNSNLNATQKQELFSYLKRKHSPATFFCCYTTAAPSPYGAELAILSSRIIT